MTYTIINLILFGLLLFSTYSKSKKINIPFLLIALYVFISLMGILYFPNYSEKKQIELWPFLYLVFVCWLYFLPITKATGIYRYCADIRINYALKIMFIIYILCALLKIGNDFSLVTNAIINGNWQSMKADLYKGVSVGTGNNIISYFANLYVSVGMYGILVYSMYSFTKKDISTIKSIFLLLIALTPYLINCVLYVYRGGLLTISYLVLCIFILYKKKMVKKKKKVLISGLSVIAIIIIILTLSISLSRFGEDAAGGSIIDYLGQSMLVFNAGIANRINAFANGQYFFLNFLGLKKSNVWIDSKYGILTDNGSALNTFVGCSYVDFGPILTVIFAILVSVSLLSIFKRRKIDFADLYLFAFYLDFLILGVFHCSEGFSLKIFMVTVLYIFLKIVGNTKYKYL